MIRTHCAFLNLYYPMSYIDMDDLMIVLKFTNSCNYFRAHIIFIVRMLHAFYVHSLAFEHILVEYAHILTLIVVHSNLSNKYCSIGNAPRDLPAQLSGCTFYPDC